MSRLLDHQVARSRGERGQVAVLSVVFLVVLLGAAGLTIDVGNAWLHKRRLQTAVDLALLSGAQKLPDTTTAAADARSFAQANVQNLEPSATVTSTASTQCQVAGCTNHDQINLSSTMTVPTYFVKLFGVSNWTVTAKGSACGPCDSSPFAYDVMIVMDRSYSMCLDSSNAYNNCADMDNALNGIKTLLPFFNPNTDYVGLTVLGSQDDQPPYSHTATDTSGSTVNTTSAGRATSCSPPDTMIPADGISPPNGKGRFYRTAGDFMVNRTGSTTLHDSWIVAPLANDFKLANGSLNAASPIVQALNCMDHKLWTPIAPAVYEARTALAAHVNPNGDATHPVRKILIYFGDGGANAQPRPLDANGNPTAGTSWYTAASPAVNDKPCQDAIAQAGLAKAAGIEVYTIGYDLNASGANDCTNNAYVKDNSITATQVMQQMATDATHFYPSTSSATSVLAIFSAIGHSITSGGTRLTA